MDISFRFNESHRASVTINVPVGGGFTINVNPVDGLTPPSSGGLTFNGANVRSPAGVLARPSSGGLSVNGAHVRPPAGVLAQPSSGGSNVNVHPPKHESVIAETPKSSLKKANPKVFFDMTVDGQLAGRVVMELFADTTPRTAENFRALCTGEKGMGKLGKPLHYKGSIFHHVDTYTLNGGDFIEGKGSKGGESIYANRYFDDENFIRKHTGPGIVTMWNVRENTNGSQFMICMREMTDYDNECVVVGQVVEGLDVITSIMEQVGNKNCCYKPSKPVVIADCGQIS